MCGQSPCPRILQSRRPHEMDVVGHQAIAKYVEAEALAVLAEKFALRTAVVINEENILTVVAALNRRGEAHPQ